MNYIEYWDQKHGDRKKREIPSRIKSLVGVRSHAHNKLRIEPGLITKVKIGKKIYDLDRFSASSKSNIISEIILKRDLKNFKPFWSGKSRVVESETRNSGYNNKGVTFYRNHNRGRICDPVDLRRLKNLYSRV